MTDIIFVSNVVAFREAIETVNYIYSGINIKILSEQSMTKCLRFELEFKEPSDLYYLGVTENIITTSKHGY